MAKYTDLSLDHKRELLTNLSALSLTSNFVEEVIGENFVLELWRQALFQVADLSLQEIESTIQILERERIGFKPPVAATIELSRW